MRVWVYRSSDLFKKEWAWVSRVTGTYWAASAKPWPVGTLYYGYTKARAIEKCTKTTVPDGRWNHN